MYTHNNRFHNTSGGERWGRRSGWTFVLVSQHVDENEASIFHQIAHHEVDQTNLKYCSAHVFANIDTTLPQYEETEL